MSDKKLNLFFSSLHSTLRKVLLRVQNHRAPLPVFCFSINHNRLSFLPTSGTVQLVAYPSRPSALQYTCQQKCRKTAVVFLLDRPINLALKNDLDFPLVKLATFTLAAVPIRPLLGTVSSVFCGTTTRPP